MLCIKGHKTNRTMDKKIIFLFISKENKEIWLKAKHLKMKIIVLVSFSHHNNIKRWSLDKNRNMLILFFGQWAKFFWFLEMFMPWWFYLLYIAWSMQKGNLRFGYVIVIQMPFSASLLFIFPKNKLKIIHWLDRRFKLIPYNIYNESCNL